MNISIPAGETQRLRQLLENGDEAGVAGLLHAAVPHMVQELFHHLNRKRLTPEEFSAVLNELHRDLAQDEPRPMLSDYACSRESFYEGHPKL